MHKKFESNCYSSSEGYKVWFHDRQVPIPEVDPGYNLAGDSKLRVHVHGHSAVGPMQSFTGSSMIRSSSVTAMLVILEKTDLTSWTELNK